MYEHFARVAKALASGIRLEVLGLLEQKEYSVEALADMLGQSLQNMSRHLQVLRQSRLVNTRKGGNFVYYRLSGPDVSQLLGALKAVSYEHLSEVEDVLERFRSHTHEFDAVGLEELLARARANEVVILDVRPFGEFAEGHLPGARNVPLFQLESRLSELPAQTPIVAYCRGRYCLLAYAAVDLLMEKGLRAERLEDGIAEWKLRQIPLDRVALGAG
jgi:rhodanese-related sulfurtransferase